MSMSMSHSKCYQIRKQLSLVKENSCFINQTTGCWTYQIEDLTKEEDFCEEVEASIAFCEAKIKKQESAQQAKDLERTYLKEYDAYKMEKNSVEPIRA